MSRTCAIEEEERGEGLVLGRGGDLLLDGEVGEEGGERLGAQLARMAAGVVDEVAADPVDVGELGAAREPAAAGFEGQQVEETRALGGVGRVLGHLP